MVTCDDAGTILNPMLVEGQRHGGIAQGVAQALYEWVRYDEDGNPQTANLADYTMISAAELPELRARHRWRRRRRSTRSEPRGSASPAPSGPRPRCSRAVCDALAPLGVRHVDMPCTPERVWGAIAAAGA